MQKTNLLLIPMIQKLYGILKLSHYQKDYKNIDHHMKMELDGRQIFKIKTYYHTKFLSKKRYILKYILKLEIHSR